MSIAAIVITLLAMWLFIAVFEFFSLLLNDENEDDEYFKNKWKDPYDIDR